MKLSTPLLNALNEQLTRERFAASLYFALAAEFEALSLTGLADWARRASAEETGHAGQFFDYLADRNATPKLAAVPAPPALGDSVVKLFDAALTQEEIVSEALEKVYALADPATCDFLLPFLRGQVQAERELTEIIGKLQRAGDDAAAMLFLDHELGEPHG